MLIGGVVQHHFDDDPNAALMGGLQNLAKILHRSVAGVDRMVVRDS